jgi:hypothetical protein
MSCDHLFLDLEVQAMAAPVRGKLRAIDAVVVEHRTTPTCPITSIAGVRTNDRGKVLSSFALKDAAFPVIHKALLDLARGDSYVVVAIAPESKKRALRDAYMFHDLADPFAGRAWLDFSQVAWPLVLAGHVQSRSLRSLGEHFKIKHDAPGTVTGDVAFLCAVYWEAAKRYRAALAGEEVVRDLGGNALASIRKVIGI